MLYLFDIDGTLIRSFMREKDYVCDATGCTDGKVSKYDLGWKSIAHDPALAAKTQTCLRCMGTGRLQPEQVYDRIEFLPGVKEKIAELRAAGHDIALVTNQGGIAFGYQTSEQINRKLFDILKELGFDAEVVDDERGSIYTVRTGPEAKPALYDAYVSFGHPQAKVEQYRTDSDWRKPGGGMIRAAMADYGYDAEDVMFIGDMDADRGAAEAAGVQFRWADDFMAGVMS